MNKMTICIRHAAMNETMWHCRPGCFPVAKGDRNSDRRRDARQRWVLETGGEASYLCDSYGEETCRAYRSFGRHSAGIR